MSGFRVIGALILFSVSLLQTAQAKIVNGEEASEKESKKVIKFVMESDEKNNAGKPKLLSFSGIAVNETTVITSAHEFEHWGGRIGMPNLKTPDERPAVFGKDEPQVEIDKNLDIAVIKFPRPVFKKENIVKVATRSPAKNDDITLMGWGFTEAKYDRKTYEFSDLSKEAEERAYKADVTVGALETNSFYVLANEDDPYIMEGDSGGLAKNSDEEAVGIIRGVGGLKKEINGKAIASQIVRLDSSDARKFFNRVSAEKKIDLPDALLGKVPVASNDKITTTEFARELLEKLDKKPCPVPGKK